MGIMAYSLLWVMQDLYHQPYNHKKEPSGRVQGKGPKLPRDGSERAWRILLRGPPKSKHALDGLRA